MGKGRRERERRATEAAPPERPEASDLVLPDYLLKLRWANQHIDTLKERVQRWLNEDRYTFILEEGDQTRHNFLYAKVEQIPSDWPLLAGDVVHNLRSALDHLAFAALTKFHDGTIPEPLTEKCEFPVVGFYNRKGEPRTHPDLDFRSIVAGKLGSVPDEFYEALRNLQPYLAGEQFDSSPLWLIHHLNRVDKHRHLNVVAGASQIEQAKLVELPYVWIRGGVVEDGSKVAEWANPPQPQPDSYLSFARQIVIGEPEAAAGREIIAMLRSLHNHINGTVVTALASFV